MANKIHRILIFVNIALCVALVIIRAITGNIVISLIYLFAAILWAINLYIFDKYKEE